MKNETTSPPALASEGDRYCDLLLVDLLHLDFKHFLSRYKTDLYGFLVSLIVTLSMIGLLALIARIGR